MKGFNHSGCGLLYGWICILRDHFSCSVENGLEDHQSEHRDISRLAVSHLGMWCQHFGFDLALSWVNRKVGEGKLTKLGDELGDAKVSDLHKSVDTDNIHQWRRPRREVCSGRMILDLILTCWDWGSLELQRRGNQ